MGRVWGTGKQVLWTAAALGARVRGERYSSCRGQENSQKGTEEKDRPGPREGEKKGARSRPVDFWGGDLFAQRWSAALPGSSGS